MRVGLLAPSRTLEDSFLHKSDYIYRHSGDNTGNFAFIEAIYRHCLPAVQVFPWHVPPEEARAKSDMLVFAAANQLGPHNDLGWLADHLEKIGLPMVVIGLGAQAPNLVSVLELSAGTDRWLRVLAALSPTRHPNISVRGEFTRRHIEGLGLGDRVMVTGCPSNFLNDAPDFYDILKGKYNLKTVDKIGVAAGSRHLSDLRDLERALVKLVTETKGAYITQADLNMLRLARNEFDLIDPAEFATIRDYIAPDMSLDQFRLWCKRHAVCHTGAPSWLEGMRSFDFVVGSRFHGVMLALQTGTPGGVIAHDSRTLELCAATGIPVRHASELATDISAADLFNVFPLDVQRFAATREACRREYVSFLEGCGIQPNAKLVASQQIVP